MTITESPTSLAAGRASEAFILVCEHSEDTQTPFPSNRIFSGSIDASLACSRSSTQLANRLKSPIYPSFARALGPSSDKARCSA